MTPLGARCDICPLKGKTPIPQTPIPSSPVRLIVVNEPNGRAEETMRCSLAGRSGGLLKKAIEDAGVGVNEVYVTPSTLCRPESDKEAKRAAECCAPRLLREVAAVATLSPNAALLVLGKEALASAMGGRKLLYARGFIWAIRAPKLAAIKAWGRQALKLDPGLKKENLLLKAETARYRRKLRKRVAVVSLAPSFISRADTWAPILRIDIARAVRISAGRYPPYEDSAPHRVWPGVKKRGTLLSNLRRLGATVSLDVETDGINPHECNLLCVGLSDGVNTLVIWPWDNKYASVLQKYLETRAHVVAHNGGYDRTVLRRYGVV